MALHELAFPSYNGRDTVKGWLYTPLGTPRAVVQVVHGFGEHSRRYLHMIGAMQDSGFVVCADDHVAHGKTASDAGTWGDPGDKGMATYIEDEHSLRKMAMERYPSLPYVMFGHSWGSMIARGYAARHGEGVAGLVLCGVVSQLRGAEALAKSGEAGDAVRAGRGKEDGTWLQEVLFRGMTDRFDNPKGPTDWIAGDADVVADHAGDPFNNLRNPPTVQLIADFVELYSFIESDAWAGMVPSGVQAYLLAGDMDPCGNYGEGLYHVANRLWETGHRRVMAQAYSGERHEIHNEPYLREEVEMGIIDFINGVL